MGKNKKNKLVSEMSFLNEAILPDYEHLKNELKDVIKLLNNYLSQTTEKKDIEQINMEIDFINLGLEDIENTIQFITKSCEEIRNKQVNEDQFKNKLDLILGKFSNLIEDMNILECYLDYNNDTNLIDIGLDLINKDKERGNIPLKDKVKIDNITPVEDEYLKNMVLEAEDCMDYLSSYKRELLEIEYTSKKDKTITFEIIQDIDLIQRINRLIYNLLNKRENTLKIKNKELKLIDEMFNDIEYIVRGSFLTKYLFPTEEGRLFIEELKEHLNSLKEENI